MSALHKARYDDEAMSDDSRVSPHSALAVPVLFILVLTVGTFVGVVRYTDVLDPQVGKGGAIPTDAFHHDPKPCLRYPNAPLRSSIETTARALLRVDLTSTEVSDLVGDFYARANTREAGLHVDSAADEHLETFSRGSGLISRLVIALKRDRLLDQLNKLLATTPPMRRTIASLPEKQRDAVDAQWTRDPAVFVLPGLMELIKEMKFQLSDTRLEGLYSRLDDQISAGKAPDLELVRVSHPDLQLQDAWGADFTLERTGDDEYTLASLGADRYAGGTGYDADLVRTLKVSPGAAPVEPRPSAECSGRTQFMLARSEFDAALQNVNERAMEARVTPALSNGGVSGFKLTKLRPGFFTSVGLCDGDVVSTLNGMPLSSPDKALEAYSKLKDATRVEIAVLRAGKLLTLVVQFR